MSGPAPIGCDISARGKLRVTGEDRVRFLNGQVTNDVKILAPGSGCYAAFTNAKGKMRADVVILNIGDSLLLDLEPGCDVRIAAELEKFIISDDVFIGDLRISGNGFAVVGEGAGNVLRDAGLTTAPPSALFGVIGLPLKSGGWLFRSRRARVEAYDIWVQRADSAAVASRLREALERNGGKMVGETELEILRVEAGIPRFGVDMDETTLPPEVGLESVAISYTKGCYLGQEVIARIKSVGHVNRTLARLRLPESARSGHALSHNGREVGKLGSVVVSPQFGRIGLAIVRREAGEVGTRLALAEGEAVVVGEFGGNVP